MPFADRRVVLSVFMGREDRASLLLRYVDRLHAMGLVDEAHLWDYTRKEADRTWLASLGAPLLSTPDRYDYVGKTAVDGELRFRVQAAHDVHVRLESGSAALELVLGGSGNTCCAVRDGAGREVARDVQLRLAPDAWNDVVVSCPMGMCTVTVNGAAWSTGVRMEAIASAAFCTCRGAKGAWDFPAAAGTPYRYCKPLTNAEVHADIRAVREAAAMPARSAGGLPPPGWSQPKRGMRHALPKRSADPFEPSGPPVPVHAEPYVHWTSCYEFYHEHRDSLFARSILLKADDDVVCIDTAHFADFLQFRVDNPQHFLVFPNVVNNGVAAHYQQLAGAVPATELQLELPPDGLCGSLWASADQCRRLHELFLADPHAFSYNGHVELPPALRFSINFFALLSESLAWYAGAGMDDEHALTVAIPSAQGFTKAIFNGCSVCHLSFYKQHEDGLDEAALVEKYAALEKDGWLSKALGEAAGILPAVVSAADPGEDALEVPATLSATDSEPGAVSGQPDPVGEDAEVSGGVADEQASSARVDPVKAAPEPDAVTVGAGKPDPVRQATEVSGGAADIAYASSTMIDLVKAAPAAPVACPLTIMDASGMLPLHVGDDGFVHAPTTKIDLTGLFKATPDGAADAI